MRATGRLQVLLAVVLAGALTGDHARAQEASRGEGAFVDFRPLATGLTVLARDSLYPISGSNELELRVAMELLGPDTGVENFYGQHQSRWAYRYFTVRDRSGSCSIDSVKVAMESTIILPRLVLLDALPEALKGPWEQFLDALRAHEEGHRSIVRQELEGLADSLMTLDAIPCDSIGAEAERISKGVAERVRRTTDQYDEDSEHGVKDGAVWPPRRRRE